MMDFWVTLIIWANIPSNTVGRLLMAPIMKVPGWLSITVLSFVLGLLLLLIFKYTSNQKAIGRVRDNIKADLLAMKLFKDSLSVTFQAQGRVFGNAFKLFYYAIVPMVIMIVPVSLILAQMSLWYQARPLQPGDGPAVVKLQLNDTIDTWPQVNLEPLAGIDIKVGPVRVFNKQEIYWKVKPVEDGAHSLVFQVGEEQYEKRLAIGDGFMPLSAKRPGPVFSDVLLYPLEKPFASDAPVHAITIAYPERNSIVSGTNWWILYFFVASMIFAFMFRPLLKVRI